MNWMINAYRWIVDTLVNGVFRGVDVLGGGLADFPFHSKEKQMEIILIISVFVFIILYLLWWNATFFLFLPFKIFNLILGVF